MAIANSYMFTHTSFDWNRFAEGTNNQYRVVASRPYSDRKGVLSNGVTVTLQVIVDNLDYGVDKDGNPRDNNLYQNFDVTILDPELNLSKGCIIQLLDYLPEYSYVLNFDLILRFRSAKVLKPAGTKSNA